MRERRNKHEQLTLPDGVEIDVGIANLLRALWDIGLVTRYSCQGTRLESGYVTEDGNEAYVLFPQASDALEFFTQTLGSLSGADRLAQIVVNVRWLTGPEPESERRKRGPALSMELSVDPSERDAKLRGVVRFDPDLMPKLEAVFARSAASRVES